MILQLLSPVTHRLIDRLNLTEMEKLKNQSADADAADPADTD